MRSEAGRLGRLVENVLSYAQIERGSAKQAKETLTTQALVDRILPHLEERVHQVGGELEVNLPEELRNTSYVIDVTGVEQILFNLVDNASKYALPHTDEKVILLDISQEHSWLVFRVSDKGPGISHSERKNLFLAFRRSAKDAAEAGAPGVGLGLALCRRIARQQGGDLAYCEGSSGAAFALRMKVESPSN